MKFRNEKKFLPGGESNPGLPRDRRGYSPLYYRGLGDNTSAWMTSLMPTFIPFFINTDKLITVSAVCRTIPERYLFTDVKTTKKAFYTLTSFSSS